MPAGPAWRPTHTQMTASRGEAWSGPATPGQAHGVPYRKLHTLSADLQPPGPRTRPARRSPSRLSTRTATPQGRAAALASPCPLAPVVHETHGPASHQDDIKTRRPPCSRIPASGSRGAVILAHSTRAVKSRQVFSISSPAPPQPAPVPPRAPLVRPVQQSLRGPLNEAEPPPGQEHTCPIRLPRSRLGQGKTGLPFPRLPQAAPRMPEPLPQRDCEPAPSPRRSPRHGRTRPWAEFADPAARCCEPGLSRGNSLTSLRYRGKLKS